MADGRLDHLQLEGELPIGDEPPLGELAGEDPLLDLGASGLFHQGASGIARRRGLFRGGFARGQQLRYGGNPHGGPRAGE